MWHEIMQQAAERERVLQGEVNFSGQQHENIPAKCGEAWNASLTRNNYCTYPNTKLVDWVNSSLLPVQAVNYPNPNPNSSESILISPMYVVLLVIVYGSDKPYFCAQAIYLT